MWNRRNEKNILPDLIFSKFFLVLCFFAFLLILFGLAKGTIKSYQVNSEIQQLQNEISHSEKQNQDFSQLITYLKSDAFVEQEAKLKLGLKKEGENLVVIPQNELAVQTVTGDEMQKRSNPLKWWAYFFGNKNF